MSHLLRLLAAAVVAVSAAPVIAQTAPPAALAPAPEGATGRAAKSRGEATRYMVAAANPLAAAAGREMLRIGGSAVPSKRMRR